MCRAASTDSAAQAIALLRSVMTFCTSRTQSSPAVSFPWRRATTACSRAKTASQPGASRAADSSTSRSHQCQAHSSRSVMIRAFTALDSDQTVASERAETSRRFSAAVAQSSRSPISKDPSAVRNRAVADSCAACRRGAAGHSSGWAGERKLDQAHSQAMFGWSPARTSPALVSAPCFCSTVKASSSLPQPKSRSASPSQAVPGIVPDWKASMSSGRCRASTVVGFIRRAIRASRMWISMRSGPSGQSSRASSRHRTASRVSSSPMAVSAALRSTVRCHVSSVYRAASRCWATSVAGAPAPYWAAAARMCNSVRTDGSTSARTVRCAVRCRNDIPSTTPAARRAASCGSMREKEIPLIRDSSSGEAESPSTDNRQPISTAAEPLRCRMDITAWPYVPSSADSSVPFGGSFMSRLLKSSSRALSSRGLPPLR